MQKYKYSVCNKAKQMAPTTDSILKISQYLNILSVQHLLPCSVLKCSHNMKFLVPLLTCLLQSQNNLSADKVLNKMVSSGPHKRRGQDWPGIKTAKILCLSS